MKKAFHLIEVACSVINAYCRPGNWTEGNNVLKSGPEILGVICVVAEFFTGYAKMATDVDDDRNNKGTLNLIEASKIALGSCQCLIIFQVGLT